MGRLYVCDLDYRVSVTKGTDSSTEAIGAGCARSSAISLHSLGHGIARNYDSAKEGLLRRKW